MRVYVRVMLLTVFALPLVADAAPKPVPALLTRARYVALGYDLGDGFLTEDQLADVGDSTLTEERRALESIHRDLDKWGKYVVTVVPEEAEVFIVVRAGRHAVLEFATHDGGRAESRGDTSAEQSATQRYGSQLSSSDDRIDVYQTAGGHPGMKLWSASGNNGLAGSPPALYKALRQDIERATKKP